MMAAAGHADREVKGWSDLAFVFLRRFAATHIEVFTAEDVTRASKDWEMVQPPTDRAWGSVYRKAQSLGIIERVDFEGTRANGNPCARYRRI